MIDIRDFGAVGDGINDDTGAIQQALNSVPGEGGAVLVSPGTFRITSGLAPKSGTKMVGCGFGSLIQCDPVGWLLQTPNNFGLLNLSNVVHVDVVDVHLRGTVSASQTMTPKIVYGQFASDISVEGCFLENSAFEGLWQGGDATQNKRWCVADNNISNVGFPAGNYYSLPAIQMNGVDALVQGNILTSVGTGIGASGARTVVSGNRINGFLLVGISTGDGIESASITITGNSIEADGLTAGNPHSIAIKIDDGSGGAHPHLVSENSIVLSASQANAGCRGIWATSARMAHVTGNVIELDGAGIGIELDGHQSTTNLFVENNLVYISGSLGGCTGIVGIPNGSANSLAVISSGNRIIGAQSSSNDFAYDFNYNGGGTLKALMIGDWADGGNVRCGANYYGSGQFTGIPINLSS
jgi:Pectate lyase superfamily protein